MQVFLVKVSKRGRGRSRVLLTGKPETPTEKLDPRISTIRKNISYFLIDNSQWSKHMSGRKPQAVLQKMRLSISGTGKGNRAYRDDSYTILHRPRIQSDSKAEPLYIICPLY